MSITGDFLTGLADLLTEASIGVHDPDRTWTAADTEWAISRGPSVPEDPPLAIVMSAYSPAPDDPKMSDSLLAVQFRLRGGESPVSVLDKNDEIFARLQGMHDTAVNGVSLVLLWRQSSLPVPADENQRAQLTSNWYARITHPGTYRTD